MGLDKQLVRYMTASLGLLILCKSYRILPYNRKIIEIAVILIPLTEICMTSFFMFDTGTSMKRGWVKLVFCAGMSYFTEEEFHVKINYLKNKQKQHSL